MLDRFAVVLLIAWIAATPGCEIGGGGATSVPDGDTLEGVDPAMDVRGDSGTPEPDDGPSVQDVPWVQDAPPTADALDVPGQDTTVPQDTVSPQDTPSPFDVQPPQDSPPTPDTLPPQDPGVVEYGPDSDVVITELHYNPPSSADDEEFIELYNRGNRPVRIGGWTFTGVTYTFPEGTVIAAGQALVSAKKPALHPGAFGPWTNSTGLNNTGETIVLSNANGVQVDVVSYLPESPWPIVDGTVGPSIEMTDAYADNGLAESWHLGPAGGTPGVFPPS